MPKDKEVSDVLEDIVTNILKHPLIKKVTETVKKKVLEGLDEAFSEGKKEEDKKKE